MENDVKRIASNKEVVRKFFSYFESGNSEAVEKLWPKDGYRLHFPGS
jgi:hypothetical protein